MGPRLLAVACVASALAVGNLYFPQALGPRLAEAFSTTPGSAALVTGGPQLGYAAGILLLVPLVDRVSPRALLVLLYLATALCLTSVACAPTLVFASVFAVGTGVVTIGAQVFSPIAAAMSPPGRRGRTAGTLLAACTGGMLLSRTLAAVDSGLGWRLPYITGAAACLVLAPLLFLLVPTTPLHRPTERHIRPTAGRPTGSNPLAGSTAWRVARAALQPFEYLPRSTALRRSCLLQACVFAAFNMIWAALPHLASEPEDSTLVWLPIAAGVMTLATLPLIGRVVDGSGSHRVNTLSMTTVIAATAVLFAAALSDGGWVRAVLLLLGVAILDAGMQSGMVANLARIQNAADDAGHSTAQYMITYMCCAFGAGASGSALGPWLVDIAGWWALCGGTASVTALVLSYHLTRSEPVPEVVVGGVTVMQMHSPA